MYLCTYKYSLYSAAVAQQDVVLTMMSGEQCFGSRVTLLCTHPNPLADSVKYFPLLINWAEDGTTIDFGDPSSVRFTATRLNSTATTLSFTVTEDRVINYTCFLVLQANRSREESNVVTIDALGKYMNLLLIQSSTFIFLLMRGPFMLLRLYCPHMYVLVLRPPYTYCTCTYICR